MTTSPDLFVAELTVYDTAIVGTRVLYYATRGFVTRTTETPASTFFDERIGQPTNVARSLFAPGTTRGRSTIGVGDLVLANGDGLLDTLLTYAFDGWPIIVRQGVFGAAYPSGFTTVFTGTMAGIPEVTFDRVIVKVRDLQASVNLPLQTTKYAGDNALPAGLEGVAADLKGKPKPYCLGKVLNVSPPCVNTSKLIYQVNNGAIQSLDAVYDSGIVLGWPTQFTDIFSNSPGGQILSLATNGSGTWVAVDSAGDQIWYSTDGPATWTAASKVGAWKCVRYGNGKFMAVGDAGVVASSSDGVTWTFETSGTVENLLAVAWSAVASLWIHAGSTGYLATSPTGVTWTSRTSQFGTSQIEALREGNGVIVAVGEAGKISTSTNATSWTARSSSNGAAFTTTRFYDVAYGVAEFRAVGSTGVIVGTNDNGVTWTRQQCTFDGLAGGAVASLNAIMYGQGLWLCGGSVSDVGISFDGSSAWQRFTIGFGVLDIAFDATRWLIATGSSGVARSTLAADAYSTLADLSDDTLAPTPGRVKVYLAGGYFRLGSSPAGLITADVTQGANAAARTAGQMFSAGILTKAGKSAGTAAGNWKAADVTALDAANAAVLGYWTDQETTFADVLDQIAGSVGASWYVDKAGLYRIFQLIAPTGTPVMALTKNDLLKPLNRILVNDRDQGVPLFLQTLTWGHNYTVQESGIAGGVDQVRRAFLMVPDSTVKSTDAAVQTAHLLAVQMDEDSLMTTATDAQTEADRRLTLRKVRRDLYELVIPLDSDSVAIDVSSTISLTHTRFGLSGGQSFTVIGVEPDAAARAVKLLVWG